MEINLFRLVLNVLNEILVISLIIITILKEKLKISKG